MKNGEHHYRSHLIWDGNRGDGTSTYAGYGRQYRILIEGKPDIHGSADAVFRGEPDKLNPEDLFLAAISSCHLLSYLALCARAGVNVLAYEDRATGTMKEDDRGGGRFEEVVLQPIVTIADAAQRDRAMELHEKAHELCFIAIRAAFPFIIVPRCGCEGLECANASSRFQSRARTGVREVLEEMIGIASRRTTHRRTGPADPALRTARVCYDYLAGERGVWLLDRLRERKLLTGRDGCTISRDGEAFFAHFAIDVESLSRSRRALCRLCLELERAPPSSRRLTRRRHPAAHLRAALGATRARQPRDRVLAGRRALAPPLARVILECGGKAAAFRRRSVSFADAYESGGPAAALQNGADPAP